MMLKAIFPIVILVASSLASPTPTLNLNKLHNIQRFIENLDASPTIYRSYLPSTYSNAINGFFHLPIIPAAIPAVRYNGVSTVYVPPQGYYSPPHAGQITGQVVGSYPVTYNGYAHNYGWKH